MVWEFQPNVRSLLDIFVKTCGMLLHSDCAVDVYFFFALHLGPHLKHYTCSESTVRIAPPYKDVLYIKRLAAYKVKLSET